MSWPEAVFCSIVTVCAVVVLLYAIERHYQNKIAERNR